MLRLFALLLWLVTPYTSLASANNNERRLRISAPDYPPFYMDSSATGQMGYAKEISTLCAQRLSIAHEFVDLPITRMFKMMKKGELDLNIMSYKSDRAEFIEFGKVPIYQNRYVPFIRHDEARPVQSLEDLAPLRIGHYVGQRPSESYSTYLEQRLKANDDSVSIVNSNQSLIKMLAKKRIDVLVGEEVKVLWYAKQLGFDQQIKRSTWIIRSQDYFWALSKKSPLLSRVPDLVERLDHCVIALKDDGSLNRLAAHYGL